MFLNLWLIILLGLIDDKNKMCSLVQAKTHVKLSRVQICSQHEVQYTFRVFSMVWFDYFLCDLFFFLLDKTTF